MKKIIIGILTLLAASCVTQKKCLQKFPPQVIIKDSIIIKDTIIRMPIRDTISNDSVSISDKFFWPSIGKVITVDTALVHGIPIYQLIDTSVIYHKEAKSKSGRVTATVDINKGGLKVDCKVDSLIRIIDSLALKLKTVEIHHSEVKLVPVIQYKNPVWPWIVIIIFIFYLLLPTILKLVKPN